MLVLLALLALALPGLSLKAFTQSRFPINLKNGHPFKGGERIVFTVHYKWGAVNADVAKAYLSLDSTSLSGRPVYHCKLYGQTARFYDMFFKVREDFQSWFTCDGIVPVRFTRDSREGNYVCTNEYSYRCSSSKPSIEAKIYSSRKGNYTASIPLDDDTYDLPALFYMARSMDIQKVIKGKSYPLKFAIDEDTYTINFIYRGIETKKVSGIGYIKCHKFSVGVITGNVFSGNSDISLWVSADKNRVPVWFEAGINPGAVQGRLRSYSGLKYPFEALEK